VQFTIKLSLSHGGNYCSMNTGLGSRLKLLCLLLVWLHLRSV